MAEITILLVEDEALIALSEKRQLEAVGYCVLHALSGERAIEIVRTEARKIDLILMDIDLGKGMDGTRAAEEILRTHDIPILFLSGHQEKEIVERTERITNYGYVVKNSSFTVLYASLKMAFKLFEAHKEINRQNMEMAATNEELRVTIERLEETNSELALSEDKFSKAFRLNPDSININHLEDGVYLDVNDGFTEIMGYTAEEVLGRSSLSKDLAIWVHDEDRALLVQGLRERGEVNNLEAEFRRKDGTIANGMMSARIIEIDGRKCIISITRDMTSRKRTENALHASETRFREAFAKAPVGISLTALDGRLQMVNEAFCRMLGREMADINALDFTSLTHPDDVARSVQISRRLLQDGAEGERFTKRYIHADGHSVWADISISVMRDEAGRPQSYIAHALDITERMETERRLRNAQLLLRSSMESVKDLVILSIDKDFNYLYFNEAYRRDRLENYGIELREGMNLLEALPRDAFLEASLPYYRQALEGRSSRVIERHEAGKAFYETAYNPIVDEAGAIIGATAFSTKVTALRTAALLESGCAPPEAGRSAQGGAPEEAPEGRVPPRPLQVLDSFSK
jgi:PAS domain S-box-containing protein